SIVAYTISSADGKLVPANGNWDSLADQLLAGWDEADNSNEFRLTEFKLSGATLLEGEGSALLLGKLINAGGTIDLEDLKFEFLLNDGQTMEGVVQLATIGNGGDFDANGVVD